MPLYIKRVYDDFSATDGYRVLVDRVWPRGVSKEHAHLDAWIKDVAPSKELRQWFGHEEQNWAEFQKRYRDELDDNKGVDEIRRIVAEHSVVTLIFSARNEEQNQAVVLRDYLSV